MDLLLTYSKDTENDYIFPDTVPMEIKGKLYTIHFSRNDDSIPGVTNLNLYKGSSVIGSASFWPKGNIYESLYITGFGATNMHNTSGRSLSFKNSKRNSNRVPVGTILINSIKEIARLTRVDKIQLTAMGESIHFYRKMGFKSDGEGVYEIRMTYIMPQNAGTRKQKNRRRRTYKSYKV